MLKILSMNISMILLIFLMNKKFYTLMTKIFMFSISMIILLMMNKSNYYWCKIFYFLGMDNISMSLILLTLWILSICLMSSTPIMKNSFNKMFMLNLICLLMLLNLSFMSMNLMMFYIFFESSLIPIMIMIMGWGMQVNRIQATMYMIFYTLFGSLPLLMMIIMLHNMMNTSMMNLMNMINLNLLNLFFYIILISAFLIKLPMYFTHLWLPKAHVEAPISGSMILAGIMLKLGSYGIYRLMIMFPKLFMKFNIIIMSITMMGSIYASLICLTQTDMKIIVAYSSIVHMGVMLSSMMSMSQWSYTSSIMMMVAHGLCSSGMFCLVNMNYERTHSRSLLINKGMLMILPSLSLWWFLLCTSNFSAPPSLNLFSEMMLFNSLILWNKFNILILVTISFISTSYSIYLYAFTQYGKTFKGIFNFKMNNCQEMLTLIIHWLPLNMMFMYMNFII
uniref:NADH dehydrogenase subunit 4 n=1 Tax=Binodoxys acalephae TaxID=55900 RepID=UPI002435B0F1|nr:NADH dehydrogenase subunit 4 [Binodoxys acalephae]WEX30812.1 NADH dehydrogenase subunit 4 [Binodoxys acalephae]